MNISNIDSQQYLLNNSSLNRNTYYYFPRSILSIYSYICFQVLRHYCCEFLKKNKSFVGISIIIKQWMNFTPDPGSIWTCFSLSKFGDLTTKSFWVTRENILIFVFCESYPQYDLYVYDLQLLIDYNIKTTYEYI